MRNVLLYATIWRWINTRQSDRCHIGNSWPRNDLDCYRSLEKISCDVHREYDDRIVQWLDLDLFFRRNVTRGEARHLRKAAAEAKRFENLNDYLISTNGALPRHISRRLGAKLRRWRAKVKREQD